MNKVLVILGPTSSSKTDLALSLAKKFNGELISCDSRQVYRGLDIGTGKMPGSGRWEVRYGKGYWDIGGIRMWMYDVVSPNVQYSVAAYVSGVIRVIGGIRERNKLPIIVGGTGLYLKALIEGLPNLAIPVDKNLRRQLEKLSKQDLQKKLEETSKDKWDSLNKSDRQNPRRLVRVIELILSSRRMLASRSGSGSNKQPLSRDWIPAYEGMTDFNIFKIGLTAPRGILYKRVDDRVVSRIKQGMISEAKMLHKNGLSLKRMGQLGLEYGVLANYLSGEIKEIEGDRGLVKLMQNKIHSYARRQLTWFKKEKDVIWFDITNPEYQDKIEKLVRKWYDQQNAT